jgi:hypothetical protein
MLGQSAMEQERAHPVSSPPLLEQTLDIIGKFSYHGKDIDRLLL